MLGLARILGLILVRGCGTRTAALQHDTIMLRATAVAHTIRHRKIIARGSDNGKKNLGENTACRNLTNLKKSGHPDFN